MIAEAEEQIDERPRPRRRAERPPFDISDFNRRLAERFGANRFGGPNIQVVWGDAERERKADGSWGLKYFRAKGPRVFKGLSQEGLVLTPRFEREELGIDRWIVERFVPPERLPFEDARRYPRGRYVHLYTVETTQARDGSQGDYRPPGEDTVEHVAEVLAGMDEEQKRVDRELERMIAEHDRDIERNCSGENNAPNPATLPA